MTTRTRIALAILLASAGIYLASAFNPVSAAPPQGAAAAPARPKLGDSTGASHFMWELFVQAVKPTGNAQAPLTFETWLEQCEIQPQLCGITATAAATAKTGAARSARRAHISDLQRRLSKSNQGDSGIIGCASMNTAGFPGIPATNVAPNAVFCEEVFVNKPESDFIIKSKLTNIPAQEAFGNVNFPWTAIEIKVDWVPQSSFVKPFSCTDPTLYIETIQFEKQPSQCYALVGMHINSKALPDWVWATFEPNNSGTNPNRCNPNLYDTCFDPWGTTSSSPYGPGQTPKQSTALANLMKSAKLAAAFNNYFLTGAQTQFVAGGQPIPLGSSFVEYNAQVPPHQASCITCHRYAYAGTPTSTLGGPLPGWPAIGYACNTGQTKNCMPPPGDKWTSEDFSWLLGIMPQTGGTGSTAKTPAKTPDKTPSSKKTPPKG